MDSFDLRLWEGFVEAGGDASRPAITNQITIDSRRIDSADALFIALEGLIHDGHRFIHHAVEAGARYILARKGWKPPQTLGKAQVLYVDDPLIALQEIAGRYRRQLPCRIIAIAGSYGKTMVKDLLQTMLASSYSVAASPESFNSQVGVPLSVLTLRKSHAIALIEVAISQKNEMDRLSEIIGADYSIITHIGKKHIATLGDMETIASELLKIIKLPPEKQWAILPNDPHILSHLHSLNADIHFWTEHSPHLPHALFVSEERGAKMAYRVDFPDGTCHHGQITSGFYYFLDLINITAKAAWLFGIPSKAISNALRAYTPEPMRTEIWRSPLGTTFINDTYCSDPQSVDRALKYFNQSNGNGSRIFIFGGMRGKHQHTNHDYSHIGKAIVHAKVDHLIIFGPHGYDSITQELEDLKTQEPAVSRIKISQFSTYLEALNCVKEQIQHNDIVLIKGDAKYPIDSITETFNDSVCSNLCLINLAAIAENLETIRRKIAAHRPTAGALATFQSEELTTQCTRVMVIVKALAYGTDDVRMAKFLESCNIDILGVSYVDEGVALKRNGAFQAIFVINAAIYEAAKVAKWGLEIGVSDRSLIDAVANAAEQQHKKVKVHLHVDTGMNRFGCRPEEALELAQLIQSYASLVMEGIMTHFACAEDPNQDAFTRLQAERFDAVIATLEAHNIHPCWRHAANSSAALRFEFPQYNMVRIGVAVYGLHSSEATKNVAEFRLAHSLVSRIVGINACHKGDTISYGRSYTVERDRQLIAVIPIGYFDGLHRNYSGKGVVIIRGQKAPMVGKICMDFMMVDVTDIPHAASGDSVLIFGEDEYGHYLSPEALAACGDSIVHELITCLGPRIQRMFIHEEAHRTH
ncbi:MAG: bifunctional UDP-N-acetylmuramoyl-tripeptide:D-alanyl-D-alanine ligase/alanine racemase [Parachlamydiaceae bacterium]